MATPPTFALGAFRLAGTSFAGLVLDDEIVDLRRCDPARVGLPAELRSIRPLLADWPRSCDALHRLAELARRGEVPAEARHALAALHAAPPFEPGQIYCTATNYTKPLVALMVDKGEDPRLQAVKGRDREALARKLVEKRALTGEPYLFNRPASSVVGADDPITLPRGAAQVGWELELGVVIGRPARHVARDRALDHVAGYVIVNDVTQHDRLARADFAGADWLSAKGGSFPLGPFLVPARFVPDPQRLDLALSVNGEVMQHDTTADMVLEVARLVEYLSSRVVLQSGDVIATGTPSGTAPQRGRYLRAGDVIEATITGLGTQRNRCIVEPG
jgi:2-keto-4-pentenoate hydratase/2-oxohepta-3-ene-1,7-dioic acid hydratase in catechol pathway